jgi:hypothetical protein
MKGENFWSLKETKYGTLAENMVLQEFIHSKGYYPYVPGDKNSHPVDAICVSGSSVFACEMKCKARLLKWNETGIDINQYNQYMNLPFKVYILFVDWMSGKVYGNWLSKLEISRQIGEIYTFRIDDMVVYRALTQQEITKLKQNESSNYRQ